MTFFKKRTFQVSLLGALAGFLNGLLGAGGGIPLLLGLRLLFGKKVANGRRFFTTALAAMLPLSLFSLYRYAAKAPVPNALFGAMLLPALAGGGMGAWLLHRLSTRALNRIFATVMALSGIFMLF
jgi:uncharacterized membrane protein YfcA